MTAPHIISLVAGKGGAGKSTVLLAIASEWAFRGFKVLIVDLDSPQHTARDFINLALAKELAPPDCLVLDPEEAGEGIGKGTWQEQVENEAANYDLIIIDTPGRHAGLTAEVMAASDLVIIPMQSSNADFWASEDTLQLARCVQVDDNPDLKVRTLISQFDPRERIGRDVRQTLIESGFEPFETAIHRRTGYKVMLSLGEGPTITAKTARRPSSSTLSSAAEVKKLVAEIERDLSIKSRTKLPELELLQVGAA